MTVSFADFLQSDSVPPSRARSGMKRRICPEEKKSRSGEMHRALPLSSPLASRDPVPFCFFKSCAKAADIRIACVPPSIEADVALVRISPEEMEELRGKGRSNGEGEQSNVLTDLISGRLRCPSAPRPRRVRPRLSVAQSRHHANEPSSSSPIDLAAKRRF